MMALLGNGNRGNPLMALKKYWPLGALAVLFGLMHDIWWWNNDELFLGLPIGLSYHVIFCLLCSLVFATIVHFNWPFKDEEGGEE